MGGLHVEITATRVDHLARVRCRLRRLRANRRDIADPSGRDPNGHPGKHRGRSGKRYCCRYGRSAAGWRRIGEREAVRGQDDPSRERSYRIHR